MNASDKVSAALLLNAGDQLEKQAAVALGALYGGIKDNPNAKAGDTLGGMLRGAARGATTGGGVTLGTFLGALAAAKMAQSGAMASPDGRPSGKQALTAAALLGGGAIGGGLLGNAAGKAMVGEYGVARKAPDGYGKEDDKRK